MTLEKLAAPPIVEVACGFVFRPLQQLDPLLVGTYWNERRNDYPKREIHPAITEVPEIFGPVRSWLMSESEELLLQIQQDRFYLNWRRQQGEYPRFSHRPGKSPGLLARTLDEFNRFRGFCSKALGEEPQPEKVEMIKIDHLIEGQHWSDFVDLAQVVPWLHPFAQFAETDNPQIALRFRESRARGTLHVLIDSASQPGAEESPPVRMIRLESRLLGITAGDLSRDFEWANEQLNTVFASLIPEPERAVRFN